jgi:hypothetical protein
LEKSFTSVKKKIAKDKKGAGNILLSTNTPMAIEKL